MSYKYLTREPIDAETILDVMTSNDFGGGSVTFFGKVRDDPFGKQVKELIYEAFEPLAEQTIDDLVHKAQRIWPVLEVVVLHRLGKLDVGEIAVAIVVLGGHRDEAYKASRFLIDEIKHTVPIWKKENFSDGSSEWGGCTHHGSSAHQAFKTLRYESLDSELSETIKLKPKTNVFEVVA